MNLPLQCNLFAEAPKQTKPPIVVHYGAGVDSTAMLVGMAQRGITPDLILFADVGAEKPETLAYVETIDAWLIEHDMPKVTVVRRFGETGTHGLKSRPSKTGNGYRTIEENMIQNETLPSLAFGRHGCSAKWKVDPQQKYLRTWKPALDAWSQGIAIRAAIGFDCTPNEQRRTFRTSKHDSDQVTHWFPLQDWGWDRERCVAEIEAAGLPIPVKSACYFCPASKEWEVLWLAAKHPDLFANALVIEDLAMPNLGSCQGLWRSSTKTRPGSWRVWAEQHGIVKKDEYEVVMGARELLARAEDLAPQTNLLQIKEAA